MAQHRYMKPAQASLIAAMRTRGVCILHKPSLGFWRSDTAKNVDSRTVGALCRHGYLTEPTTTPTGATLYKLKDETPCGV